MIKRKLLAGVLSIGLLTVSVTPALAEDFNAPGSPYIKTELPITIQVDGSWLPTDTAPIIENGRTLVPLRAAGEAIGAEITWDQASRTATAVKDDLTVKFSVGSNSYTVNGYTYTTDVPPQMNGWRTMLPIRAFGDAFGVGVSWDNSIRNVDIDTPAPDAPEPMYPNGSDPEYVQLLLKYYVPKDQNKPLNGTYFNSRTTDLTTFDWEMSAISISQADDGTLRTAIMDDVFHQGRSTGEIALYVDDGSTLTKTENGFSVEVGPGPDYICGNHLMQLNHMIRHYTIENDSLIYTHVTDESGGRFYVKGNNFKLHQISHS